MLNLLSRKPNLSKPDESQEMILLTIERAAENGRTLSLDDLARELNLSPAAHVQSLITQALLRVDSAGALVPTDAGHERARALLRRHRLSERFFTDVLGLDWARAHEEADKFEHVVSAEVEKQLADQLGNPDTCPHGNPIPPICDTASPATLIALTDCVPPAQAIIARIGLETPAALRHLATLGLLPNIKVVVENKAPFDGPVLVRVGRAHYALGHDLAARIWVKQIHNS